MYGVAPNPLTEPLNRFRSLYGALFPKFEAHCLLDSCGWTGETGGFYLMAFDAQETVTLKGQHLWHNGACLGSVSHAQQVWDQLEQITKRTRFRPQTQSTMPFYQGWIAALAYELAGILEPHLIELKPTSEEAIQGEWVRFAHIVLWHPESGSFDVVSEDAAFCDEVRRLWQGEDLPLSFGTGFTPNRTDSHSSVQASMDEATFCTHVETLKAHIAQGDLYQANLSMRFVVPSLSQDQLWQLYLHLVSVNPSPFSGMLVTPNVQILSNSPERLVRGHATTRRLDTRPIAGTRGRAKSAAEAQKIAHTLTQDVKEQAEHMMLVDLERNDLGRVSTPGSVEVTELGVLEQYSHVTHLVSQVEGLWDTTYSLWQVLEAMFPGGTITGCPKIRCMEILNRLEPVPRGFYTGSLGYIDDRGNMDFNILIRSLFGLPQGQMAFHAGAGIVADSVGIWEYRECHRKAAAIEGALGYDRNAVHH